ncbi:MAG: septal ring lytic transglycosylase RlpA family protein [Chloroflexota bacterium]
MSTRIDFKRALKWLSSLLVAVMIQSCSIMSGSLHRSVSDPADSAVFSKFTPAENRGVAASRSGAEDGTNLSSVLSSRHVGEASWYGPGFRGKKTASGDVFDDEKFTAAHKTLPLGSRVRVTNLSNKKFVEVEINDRGPFVAGRIIDLSRAAARRLGMIDDGTAKVQVELLGDSRMSEQARSANR